MKKFFRKLFRLKPKPKPQWMSVERDEKGRWIYGDHPSARKLAVLNLPKNDGCCGGEGCKCKKSNN